MEKINIRTSILFLMLWLIVANAGLYGIAPFIVSLTLAGLVLFIIARLKDMKHWKGYIMVILQVFIILLLVFAIAHIIYERM